MKMSKLSPAEEDIAREAARRAAEAVRLFHETGQVPIRKTGFGAAYDRVSNIFNDDSLLDELVADTNHTANDLLIWRCSTGRRGISVAPTYPNLPNPLVWGDLVIAVTFSPGRVVAVSLGTGERKWSTRLRSFGGSYALPYQDMIILRTPQEILALSQRAGKERWAFSPYGLKGETIYSDPVVSAESVYFGDRRGWLHCLAAESGKPKWAVRTSRARNDDVNATPLAHEDRVIVASNAQLLAAFEASNGRQIWKQRIDGPSTGQVRCADGKVVIHTSRSVYWISPNSGEILNRWTNRRQQIEMLECVDGAVFVVTRKDPGANRPLWPVSELVCLHDGAETYRGPYPRWASPSLRYEPITGFLYESTRHGMGITDPSTGRRLYRISEFEVGRHGEPLEMTARPLITDEVLYILTEVGSICALRHPG